MSLDDQLRQIVREEVQSAIGSGIPRQAWTVDEVATSLGVGRSTVHDWIRKGDIKAFRVGNVVRVSVVELERFLAERSVTR